MAKLHGQPHIIPAIEIKYTRYLLKSYLIKTDKIIFIFNLHYVAQPDDVNSQLINKLRTLKNGVVKINRVGQKSKPAYCYNNFVYCLTWFMKIGWQ